MELSGWQWALLALGAFATGLSKTGIAGLGVLTVALFSNALPARASTGALLPLLVCADLFGVAFFRKHACWPHLWKLFPWVIVGVVSGYFAMGFVNDTQMRRLIGIILIGMIGVHYWRQFKPESAASLPHAAWFTAVIGVLAGFTTMIANAAGPVMILYFLAIGLPKLEFIGTGAWFFMMVNAFKVPWSVQLGLITPKSLLMDAILLIPMIPGAFLGPRLVQSLNQRAFEGLALTLTIVAAVRLLM